MIRGPQLLRDLTPIQQRLLEDEEHRFFVVCCGRRSRKTLIAARKVLLWAMDSLGRYFLCAPVYAQAKNIFWSNLLRDTKLFQKHVNRTDLSVVLKNGSEIVVCGLDRPERIEGMVWHGGAVSESANCKKEMWFEHLRPCLSDTNGKCILESTPEGRLNWLFDMATHACSGRIPEAEPYHGAFAENGEWCYYSWHSADVLPSEEIEAARASMDNKSFCQEYEATFTQSEGLVYSFFVNDYRPAGHLDPTVEYDRNLAIYVGLDYNINPMCCSLSHLKTLTEGENKGKQAFHVFRSYSVKNCNTRRLSEMLLNDYPDCRLWLVTSCQSGAARQSSADATDRNIMREIFVREGHRVSFKHRTKNPKVRARVNALNTLFDKNLIYINPATCVSLIHDLNTVSWTESGDIDKSDAQRTHLTDGLSYLAEFTFPVRSSEPNFQIAPFLT